MKVNCQFPLGPSAESPPNYSWAASTSWESDSAAGAALHHRSRSIAHIPRIARIQYGDRNLLGWWHHQTSTNIKDTESIKSRYWRFLLVSLDGICTVLYLCLSLCRCDPSVCVIASSDSWGQVTRSPGPISIVPVSDQWQSWPGSTRFKDGHSGQRGLWCLTRICVWCSLSVSSDLSSLSDPQPLPSIPVKGHSSHMFMSPSVCLWHYRMSAPGLMTRGWYDHVILKLSSWAELRIIMFVTIWQFASEPVITNSIVPSRMSPSPCAMCHCVRVNTGLTLHQRRSSASPCGTNWYQRIGDTSLDDVSAFKWNVR